MTAPTTTKVALSPQEKQVLEGLAAGDSTADIARRLEIRHSTVGDFLKTARIKLHGACDSVAAVAAGFATGAIGRPPLLDPEAVFVSREQRELVPLIARGLSAEQVAAELKPPRPVADVRADARELLSSLGARNRCHLVTRAWQYRLLTEDRVSAWLG
ncbi:LuxR C-terminal-related transcriptional regulator [Streptomyces sp. NPDC007070]|uniref:LuxR C-terminal-related transcriptional regulator n=1 Tax=Streptomyces sp. NPDC007070 TaxID=3154312 RepID=UPI0033CCB7AC